MIDIFNFETAHYFGDALPASLKLRYEGFIERLGYDVPNYNLMEYDGYDNPAAVYLTWKDEQKQARATARLIPTSKPYMIKDLWPEAVQFIELPHTPSVWEASRLYIDKALEPALRKKIHGEILCAYLEFALRNGINSYIGIAPPKLWPHTFLRCGWPVEFAGNPIGLGDNEKVVAGLMHISPEILRNVRNIMGISYPVLTDITIPIERVA